MFVKRLFAVSVAALAFACAALGAARPSSGGAEEARYVVRPGDTLWEIAAERYDGDPREAIWRIKERNGLARSDLQPGTVLALPP